MKKITTEAGSVYNIDEHGICRKVGSDGTLVSVFKAWSIKKVPDEVETMDEVWKLEDSEPEIGYRMYIAGRDEWWVSTKVSEVEFGD